MNCLNDVEKDYEQRTSRKWSNAVWEIFKSDSMNTFQIGFALGYGRLLILDSVGIA
jgi:hypothetical protein